MKKIAPILFTFLLFANTAFGQSSNKDVAITTSGTGSTEDKAIQIVLRKAIEQAFGTFISAKTEILNDELITDEITSITSGNIKSYEVLNASELPNGSWGVTLKSIVSIDKLTSFVQAKGVEVEIKGGLFALNIKQQILNEQAEIDVMTNMLEVLHESFQLSYDYSLETFDPISVDNKDENWKIPMNITVKTNENAEFTANYCISILKEISLTENEVESFLKLGKKVYRYGVFYNNKYQLFSFRSYHSIEILDLIKQMMAKFYPLRFIVDSGIDSLNGHEIKSIHLKKFRKLYNEGCDNCPYEFKSTFFWDDRNLFYTIVNKDTLLQKIRLRGLPDYRSINSFFDGGYLSQIIDYNKAFIVFQNSNQIAVQFKFPDYRSLQEIEQLSMYSVRPEKDYSLFRDGGFVVIEKNGQSLICAPFDLGTFDQEQGNLACDKFVLSGFNDWYLPSRRDLNYIALNLSDLGIGEFKMHGCHYLTNEIDDFGSAELLSFRLGWKTSSSQVGYEHWVRPVRKR
jgi:hypothetical protein